VEQVLTWSDTIAKARRGETDDPHTHLRSPSRIDAVAKFVSILAITIILMVPLVVVYVLESDIARLAVMLVAIFLAAVFLAVLTRSRRFEVFAGTAA
jgi:uncharacterized protein DUF6594